MRRLLPILTASLIIVVSAFGCASWRANKAALNKNGADAASAEVKKDSAVSKAGAKTEQPTVDGPDPNEREEVNRAALEFAAEQRKVQHVKTCYSKIFGGWYMLIFMEDGKNVSMTNYSWDPKDKIWKTAAPAQKVTPDQVKFELEGDLAGEYCTKLK
jgi:hypothetical protein